MTGRTEIDTPRLRLRAATVEDAEHLNAAFRDAEVMRYWSEPPHPTLARTLEWTTNMSRSPQNGTTDFIICLRPTMIPVGKIGVWQDQEIGFLLAREQWGKGFAFEALHAILRHLFFAHSFQFLTADVDPRNEASIGLLKKVGFEDDGYQANSMEIDGVWVDSQYLKLTKDQWKSAFEVSTKTCIGAET